MFYFIVFTLITPIVLFYFYLYDGKPVRKSVEAVADQQLKEGGYCNELYHRILLHTTIPTYRGYYTDSPKPYLGERIRSWMIRAGVMMMPVAYAPRIGTKSAVA